jgi:hypothetical protein
MNRPSSLRLLAALVALAAFGCGSLDNCPDALDPITIDTGKTDVDKLVYESAPWDGGPAGLDPFPAKTELRFKHGLGVTPLIVKAYLSFTKNGTNGASGGSVAESAGNQDLIECVDSHVIVLKNDTCERSFFVRVVAAEQAPEDLADKCGP